MMTSADWSNLVLTVCTGVGVGIIGFVLVVGMSALFRDKKPDDYPRSKRCRENLFKTPR